MNLTSMTAVAANFAGDPGQTRYSGLYTGALNLGQQQFALDSKCLWKDQSTTVSNGTSAYTLPTDFMWEKKATFNGLAISPISRQELEKIYVGTPWTGVSGTPTNYIIDPDVSKNQTVLFPVPAANDDQKTLVLTYFALPTDLSSGTDIPFNSTLLLAQFHIGVCAWAAWYLMQGEVATPEVTQKKRDLLQIYNDQVSLATETFKNTASELFRQRGARIYK